MKATICESDNTMWIELQAENMLEAAAIVRMKNITKKSVTITQAAHQSGEFYLNVHARKHRHASGEIKS